MNDEDLHTIQRSAALLEQYLPYGVSFEEAVRAAFEGVFEKNVGFMLPDDDDVRFKTAVGSLYLRFWKQQDTIDLIEENMATLRKEYERIKGQKLG